MNMHNKFQLKNTTYCLTVCLSLIAGILPAQANPAPFYESRNDRYRTGANLNETLLNTSTVNHANFGLLFTMPVNQKIVTQTLYAPNVAIQGYVHNVVYITTISGSVYAYDADAAGSPLWVNKIIGGVVIGTPIINPATNTLYLVQKVTPPGMTLYNFELHALDLTTGAEKFGGPKTITGTYSAAGYTLNFPGINLDQHAGLALSNGQLIITFGSSQEGSGISYNGWVMSYNAATLQQTAIFPTTIVPPANGGGIWQSGRAPAIDANGYIYLFVGNVYPSTNFETSAANGYDGVNNFSESLLKFDANLHLIDWFTPGAWSELDATDMDLSSSGPILIPGTNLLTGGGKDGNVYLWNTANLGKYNANDAQVVQKFGTPANSFVYSGPVFWTRTAAQGNSLMFNVYQNSPIYAYAFNGNTFNVNPVSASLAADASNAGFTTAIALSANGGNTGTGIVWALMNNAATNSSVLRAYNAENLGNELWDSSSYISDSLGGATTYIPPTVSNGKVYTPTLANQLVVYGLFSNNTLPSLKAGANVTITRGKPISYPITASDSDGDVLTYGAAHLPPGLTVNAATGLIQGTPTTDGVYQVTIGVTDNQAGMRTSTFICTVTG